jgi:FkbM family methyltransferase
MDKHYSIVQIGANNGVEAADAIQAGYSCLLVEPQSILCDRMREEFSNYPNVIIECAAIGRETGIRPFYRITPGPDVPDFVSLWGSFNQNHIPTLLNNPNILAALPSQLSREQLLARVEAEDVRTLAFGDLVVGHDIASVDLLIIDTEGADMEILRSIDFGSADIRNIIFEISHSEGPHQSKGEHLQLVLKLLNDNSYMVCPFDRSNYVAFKNPELRHIYPLFLRSLEKIENKYARKQCNNVFSLDALKAKVSRFISQRCCMY